MKRKFVREKPASYPCPSRRRMGRRLENNASGGIQEPARRKIDSSEVVTDQKVLLVGDASQKSDVNRSGNQRDARLLERQVELTGPRIGNEVRPLDIQIDRNVERGHVRQAPKREKRIYGVVCL